MLSVAEFDPVYVEEIAFNQLQNARNLASEDKIPYFLVPIFLVSIVEAVFRAKVYEIVQWHPDHIDANNKFIKDEKLNFDLYVKSRGGGDEIPS